MALLKHMSESCGQSGSLKDRYTFSGAGQRLRSAAQTWVPESKARTKSMPTIDPGSLSMSYERKDTVILQERANGESGCIWGTGLTGQLTAGVRTHAPTQQGLHAATGGVDVPKKSLE